MKIVDFVRPELVVANLTAHDKSGVLSELAAFAAPLCPGLTPVQLTRVLNEREKLASTAIGEGVAIPHGKFNHLSKLIGCVGRAPEGVSFEAIDGRPTFLFFVLLAPENSTGLHLKALARISRLFKDSDFRSRLMQAKDAPGMFKIISDEDAKY